MTQKYKLIICPKDTAEYEKLVGTVDNNTNFHQLLGETEGRIYALDLTNTNYTLGYLEKTHIIALLNTLLTKTDDHKHFKIAIHTGSCNKLNNDSIEHFNTESKKLSMHVEVVVYSVGSDECSHVDKLEEGYKKWNQIHTILADTDENAKKAACDAILRAFEISSCESMAEKTSQTYENEQINFSAIRMCLEANQDKLQKLKEMLTSVHEKALSEDEVQAYKTNVQEIIGNSDKLISTCKSAIEQLNNDKIKVWREFQNWQNSQADCTEKSTNTVISE